MLSLNCRSCGSSCSVFLDLGKQPLANAFYDPVVEKRAEDVYHLRVAQCSECELVQLVEQPPAVAMFHENYPFFSHTSSGMRAHFAKTFNELETHAPELIRSGIWELGSNDGVFLKFAVNNKFPHLGFEPSENVRVYSENEFGINTSSNFFSGASVEEALKRNDAPGIIYGANVFCHISDIRDVLAGASEALESTKGLLVFEDPYWGDISQKGSYDQFYDEHVFAFSLSAVKKLSSSFGFNLYHASHLDTHGGSMRYFLSKDMDRPASSELERLERLERNSGVLDESNFACFQSRVDESKEVFLRRLDQAVEESQGNKIFGFGATSKATTALRYCGISNSEIEGIFDNTPSKIGKRAPGSDIPVLDAELVLDHAIGKMLLLAWNHKNEILSKVPYFKDGGGFFTYL